MTYWQSMRLVIVPQAVRRMLPAIVSQLVTIIKDIIQDMIRSHLGWLVVWGITVAGESPQFSTLTATNAPREGVGSVLTLTNSIGFAISILSIQLFVWLAQQFPLAALLPWMGIGPVLGVWALMPLLREA